MGLLDALDPSPFGVNIHAADELLPVFTGIGIRWFRIDANWNEMEPEQGRFDWSPTDRMLDAAEEAGASVLASVAYTPSWASAEARRAGLTEAVWPSLPPADPETFVRFVQAFTERYATRLGAISIWNEPDHEKFWRGSPEDHAALLVPALRQVRATAPDLVTCGPDLSTRRLQATGSIEGLCATLLGSDEFAQRRREVELEAIVSHCLRVLRGEPPSADERRRLAEAICSDQATAALAALLRERAT